MIMVAQISASSSAKCSWSTRHRKVRKRLSRHRIGLTIAFFSAVSSTAQKPRSPYDALNADRQEIRLLSLAPGNFEDDLVITLRTVSLTQDKPSYHALSYAWGTESVSERRLSTVFGWLSAKTWILDFVISAMFTPSRYCCRLMRSASIRAVLEKEAHKYKL